MKRFIRPLVALGLSLLPLAPLSAVLDTKIVGADAQWILYLDLNSLRESTVGREIVKQVETVQIPVKSASVQLSVPRLLQTIGSVTAYGTNLSQDPKLVDGALILQGAPELRQIAEGFVAQATITSPETLVELKDLPFEAYAVQGELIVAFPPEPIVLVSKSKEQLLNAHAVFLGQAKSLAKASESPLRSLIRNETGSFVLAASVVPSEKFFPDDAPQARILQMAKSGSLELGESGAQTFAHVQLLASSDETADKLMKILQGITAMISLAETSDKALADFLKSVTVARERNTVTLHLAYASDRLVEMIRELQDQSQKNSTETIRSGDKQEVKDGPVPPVEEKVIAQWTADQDLGGEGVGPGTLVSQTIANVALTPGSVIVLTGHRDGGENARFDYVEITPAAGGRARRIEAEDMTLENYKVEGERRSASREKLIQTRASYGTARFPFDGLAGTYTLTVRYVDENDGKSSFFVSVKDPQPEGQK